MSEPYIAIGLLREVDWDWDGAEEAFRRAIELNPGDAFAHYELGQLWMRLGRPEEALAREKKALHLDPLSRRYQTGVGAVYLFSGRYDEAITELKKARELETNAVTAAQTYLGRAYWLKGMYEQALSLGAFEWTGCPDIGRARHYAVSGERENASQVLKDLKAQWAQGDAKSIILWCIAWIYTDLGEKDQALDWLDQAYQEHLGLLIYLKVEPGFYPLHGEPRFQALLEKMGFPK